MPHQPHAQRRVGRIAAQGRVEAGSDAVHGRGSPASVAQAEAGPFGVLLEPAQQRAGDPEHAVGIAHWTSASADRGGAFAAPAPGRRGRGLPPSSDRRGQAGDPAVAPAAG